MNSRNLDRRLMLGAAAASGVLSALPASLTWAAPIASQMKNAPQGAGPGVSDADVIVIGSGAAGLAAAIEAADAGASVIVLEKMPTIGGNTLVSSGVFNAPDPERQKPFGIEDSPELFFRQTYEAGRFKGNPELIRIMTSSALSTKTWLESLGQRFRETPFEVYGGLWPRSFWPKISHGRGYIAVLLQALEARRVPVMTEMNVKRFVRDPSGRMTGVVVANDGASRVIRAHCGIVLNFRPVLLSPRGIPL